MPHLGTVFMKLAASKTHEETTTAPPRDLRFSLSRRHRARRITREMVAEADRKIEAESKYEI